MANIDELTKKIDELISVIKNIGNTPNGYQLDEEDIRKKFEIETRGMDKRTKEYKKMYEEMELALEMHRKNMQRIQDENNQKQIEEQEKTLAELEKRIKNHGKNKIQLLNEEFKREKEILIAAGKDTTELEKEYAEKRNEILKSSLIDGNKTVFEELNERFEKEYELYKEAGKDTYELEKAYNKKRKELFLKQSQQLVSSIQSLVSIGEKQLKEVQDTWGVADHAAHQYGRTIGLNSKRIAELRKETVSWMSDNDISKKYNIGIDEMFKVMGEYNKGLGRAVSLSHASLESMSALKNVMGEASAIKFTADLDKFGIDVKAAAEIQENIINSARTKGLVLENLSENVLSNMDLVQQYTFEDGVEGFTRMAEKATAIKWDMKQTAAFAEKVNNVEGAIKTGAQLSVLGGPFAQFSNPMGMLYESLNDMEGLQDRMFAMFSKLGSWNTEKGMLDISVFNKQRIKAAASAMGLDYGQVLTNVQAQARRNKVLEDIEYLNFDNNTRELIANTAQLDSGGSSYITYKGEDIKVSDIDKRNDKDKILEFLKTQANSQAEDIKTIAQNTLSANEMIEAIHKEFVVDRADFFESIGVSKSGMAAMAESLMYINYGLEKIQMLIQVLTTMQAVSSSFSGFRGGFKGRGRGAFGLFGKMGSKSAASFARATSVKGASTVAGKIGRGALKGVGGIAKGISSPIGMLAAFGGGYLMDRQADRLMANGNYDDAAKVQKGSSALTWASTGAMIGGAILPGWGHVIGGVLGGVAGWLSGGKEAEKAKLEAERTKQEQDAVLRERDKLREKGIILSDVYTSSELLNIQGGRATIGDELKEKIINNDGEHTFMSIPANKFANGGPLNGFITGPSHEEGGIKFINKATGQINEMEGNEYVMNSNAALQHRPLLDYLNYTVSPRTFADGGSLMGSFENISKNNEKIGFFGVGGDINMKGGIQVSLVGGESFNIKTNDLTRDPGFIRSIRDEIIKEINLTHDKSFKKDNYYRKF